MLEAIALREGFLSDSDVIMEGIDVDAPIENLRGMNRLLSNIVLFERIDSGFSEYNWKKLVTKGLVPESPLMHRVRHDESTEALAAKDEHDKALLQKCRELTFKVMRQNRRK